MPELCQTVSRINGKVFLFTDEETLTQCLGVLTRPKMKRCRNLLVSKPSGAQRVRGLRRLRWFVRSLPPSSSRSRAANWLRDAPLLGDALDCGN